MRKCAAYRFDSHAGIDMFSVENGELQLQAYNENSPESHRNMLTRSFRIIVSEIVFSSGV